MASGAEDEIGPAGRVEGGRTGPGAPNLGPEAVSLLTGSLQPCNQPQVPTSPIYIYTLQRSDDLK